MDMVAAERREYQKKCEQAGLYPDRFCSLIIDGGDQSVFGLPHFLHNAKNTKGHSLKVKLIGVLEHAAVKNLSLYTMTEEFETGANHVIEVLHRTLMLKFMKSPLPHVLYVQLDNCTRENKNRFIFTYFKSLVALGVFEEVYASFLPIGHTHADIDQTFSCTSNHLRYNEAITMIDLITELGQSYTPTPTVSRILHVINFLDLCKQEKCLRNVDTFYYYRYFKFHRVEGDPGCERDSFKTACYVRVGCRDEWKPLGSGQSRGGFIKFSPDLLNTPPTPATSPNDVDEINKRLRSEETRIGNTTKLRELRDLRDEVYCTRKDKSHWKIEEAFELKGRFANKHGQATDEYVIERTTVLAEPEEYITAEKDLEYKVSEFVAVQCEGCTKDLPFWIGRIKKLLANDDGVVVSLYVHWFEVYNRKGAFKGKYALSYLYKSKRPWTQNFDVDTVITGLARLTTARTLASQVAKKIRESLGIA